MQTCGDTYTSRSRCSWVGPPVDARRAAATTAARSREELRRGSHQSTTAYATAAAAKIKATATANAASVADTKPMAAYRLAAEGGPAPLPQGDGSDPNVRHGHVEIVKHHHCAVANSHTQCNAKRATKLCPRRLVSSRCRPSQLVEVHTCTYLAHTVRLLQGVRSCDISKAPCPPWRSFLAAAFGIAPCCLARLAYLGPWPPVMAFTTGLS